MLEYPQVDTDDKQTRADAKVIVPKPKLPPSLRVNRIISKGENVSRVTIRNEWFKIITKSNLMAMRKATNRTYTEPEMKAEYTISLDGKIYNVYNVEGVGVLYRYDAEIPRGENPHVFIMRTSDALRLLSPLGKEMSSKEELRFDFSNPVFQSGAGEK